MKVIATTKSSVEEKRGAFIQASASFNRLTPEQRYLSTVLLIQNISDFALHSTNMDEHDLRKSLKNIYMLCLEAK